MAIAIHCRCGKSLSARPELAGRKVKCPACGATLTVAAQAAAPVDAAAVEAEPPEQLELALLQLRRLFAASQPAASGGWAAAVGLGCLGAVVTMFVVVAICIAIVGAEAQEQSKSPVPGLLGMVSGLLAMVAIIGGLQTRRRRKADAATRHAEAAVQTATATVLRRFPVWAKRVGAAAALHSEEAVNDALAMVRRANGPATDAAVAGPKVPERMGAVPPIPIYFKVWSMIPLRPDEKIDKWDMLGKAFVAAESGAIVLTGFHPLSDWLLVGTLGIAGNFLLRGFFLKMREEMIRPEDVRRVVINKEVLGHCSYHIVVDRGAGICAVHLFIAANKANDKYIAKLFKTQLAPDKVTTL
jgi:hypothetical protein